MTHFERLLDQADAAVFNGDLTDTEKNSLREYIGRWERWLAANAEQFDIDQMLRQGEEFDKNAEIVSDYLNKQGISNVLVEYSNDNPLDAIAVNGKAIFVENSYQSRIVENPTWLEMCLLANEMILATGDNHHIFLEGVVSTSLKVNGVPVYHFSMGS